MTFSFPVTSRDILKQILTIIAKVDKQTTIA